MEWSAIGNSLGHIFEPVNLVLVFLGAFIGIVAGALPGFSASNACAIMLPVTLSMTAEGALIFFSSIYIGAMYGGSIPAILVNTPGTPGASATVLDGYPMAIKGYPDRALGISLMASFAGTLISTVILLFVINPIAEVAFKFGPPEMFAVSMFGLSIISSVVGKEVKKGLLSGFLGLLIAAMVADPARSIPRLTFGFLELYDTVPFVPAVIGLFAMSEMFFMMKKDKIASGNTENIGNVSEIISGMKEVVARPLATLKASLIGTLIGAIPGTGSAVATFVSYAEVKRSSKHPEEFGQGAPEGIIASEAANNGVTGGAFIPMLTLGVPGSSTMAIMMAALLLHGVRPGPELMTQHTSLAYIVMLSLFFAAMAMLVLGGLLGKYFAKVVLIPTTVLIPVVLSLCIIGAFAYRNAMFDGYLIIIFGVLGYFMKRHDYPAIPLVLGLILGPLAETSLYRSLQMSGGKIDILFNRPITIVLWIIIFLTIFGRPLYEKYWAKSKS